MKFDLLFIMLFAGITAITVAGLAVNQEQKLDELNEKISDLELKVVKEGLQEEVKLQGLQEFQKQSLNNQLQEQELLLRGLVNTQNEELEDLDKELDKKTKILNEKTEDFSSVIREALPNVVKITINIPVEINELVLNFEDLSQGLANRGYLLRTSITPTSESLPLIVGSGAIINKEGAVITNKHVVDVEAVCNDPFFNIFFTCTNEPITIDVISGDGKISKGTIIGVSTTYDIALLNTDLRGTRLLFEEPKNIKAGDEVIALGSPQDLDFTITQGIISSLKRDLNDGLGPFWLQTDTPINPGNSGGPLINKEGKIVGIVTLGSPFSQGLNFAIPSDIATAEAGKILS
ncbi:MAG: trypsin-like peptidase domain-containing protein [Candidatus Woesearchaeota archaeon]|nr:MAG: trypsin-like peptidase domain-containing protein [Candidatus Woesearchaeota archaeon]